MQVMRPQAKLALNPDLRMSDEQYWDFCVANPDVRFERTSQGEIVVVPPAGGESAYRGTDIGVQLGLWSKEDGRGKAFGSSVEFILLSGAAYSPDAAWVSNPRLAKLTKDQKRKFPPVCPEFVVEVMSPTDRLKAAKAKMREWLDNGVELGWLVDGDKRAVYIYRADQEEPEKRTRITTLNGEGPIAGFVLDLKAVWAGL